MVACVGVCVGGCVFVIYLCLAICIAPMFYLKHKLGGLKSAKVIIKEQFNPIPKKVIEQGFTEFKGEDLNRYKALVLRHIIVC